MFREGTGILATFLLVADFHRSGQWPNPASIKRAIDAAKLFSGEMVKREPELRKFEDELYELRRKAENPIGHGG